MAEATTLTQDEQQEIYHAQTFKLASSMAADWTRTLGEHTPSALIAAIDAFAQCLRLHIGGDATAKLLDELARTLREMDDNPEPAQ